MAVVCLYYCYTAAVGVVSPSDYNASHTSNVLRNSSAKHSIVSCGLLHRRCITIRMCTARLLPARLRSCKLQLSKFKAESAHLESDASLV